MASEHLDECEGFLENGFRGGSLTYSVYIKDNNKTAAVEDADDALSMGVVESAPHDTSQRQPKGGKSTGASAAAAAAATPRPPSLLQPNTTAPYHIDLIIQSATNLPADNCDPRVTIASILLAGEVKTLAKTSAKQKNKNPVWDEAIPLDLLYLPRLRLSIIDMVSEATRKREINICLKLTTYMSCDQI